MEQESQTREVKTNLAQVTVAYKRQDLFPGLPIQGWYLSDEDFKHALGLTAAPDNSSERIYDRGTQTKPAYGRSFYIPLDFESNDGTRFGCLYFRGIGGGNPQDGDINKLDDSKRYRDNKDTMRGNAGLADKKTSLQEAYISEYLHRQGVRIRLPVAGFNVSSVVTNKGVMTIKELIDEGHLNPDYLKNPPVISVWARRNPWTFRDAYQAKDYDTMVKEQAHYLRLENNPQCHKAADAIRKGDLTLWFQWMAEEAGKQFAINARVGYVAPNFHDQNITLSIEGGDIGDERAIFEPLAHEQDATIRQMHVRNSMDMIGYIADISEFVSQTQTKFINRTNREQLVRTFISHVFSEKQNLSIIDDFISICKDRSQGIGAFTNYQVETAKIALKYIYLFKVVATLQDEIAILIKKNWNHDR